MSLANHPVISTKIGGKQGSLGCYWCDVCRPPQQGWMFVEMSMSICPRASKEPWPSSEESLVAKNVFCSLKILAHITF